MRSRIDLIVAVVCSATAALALAAAPQASAAEGRRSEKLDRGLVARPLADGKVYLGWRLLAADGPGGGFHVVRQTGESAPVQLTDQPLTKTTDFVDAKAEAGQQHAWYVQPTGGQPSPPVQATPATDDDASLPYARIKLQGDHTFQKVGIADLDGDGACDFVIKQPNANVDPYIHYWKPSSDTYKLEAYGSDGAFLWRHDLGWSIESGIWYSPYVVYDLDGDGCAEVALKTGEGDPRDADGRVQTGPEFLTLLDGRTGQKKTQIAWPDRALFGQDAYNYASRNQLGIAYLDGKTPSLIVGRGTYQRIIIVAYDLRDGQLQQRWMWDNKDLGKDYWGQGAHWMHAADVDEDGRDEVLVGSFTLDDNGRELWSTGLGHPDHFYVGDIDPSRPGLEIYYGIERRQPQANGMCLVDARSGKILWGHQGPTRHVHGYGLCSDIDASHPGSECYSTDTDAEKKAAWSRLRAADGQVLSDELLWGFGPRAVYWDADLQRELLTKSIFDFGSDQTLQKIEGSVIAVADVLGDWREEVITSVAGELRIYITTIPAADRRLCLLTDPIYRLDVAHGAMGYYQVPMTSYDLQSSADR